VGPFSAAFVSSICVAQKFANKMALAPEGNGPQAEECISMNRKCLVLLATIAYLAPARCQTPEEKRSTVAFIRGLQVQTSGFLPAPAASNNAAATPASVRATTAGLRALKYFGGAPRDKLACEAFVRSCFDPKSGGFADRPGGQQDVGTTSAGLMAVAELKLPAKEYTAAGMRYLTDEVRTFEEIRIAAAALESIGASSPQARAWLEQIARMHNPDGTYGKDEGVARATGGAVVAVLRLGGKIQDTDAVVRSLLAGQRSDGGFGKEGNQGSDLESSYRVVRAFVMLKKKPDIELCRAFVARCRNLDGGYGLAPGQRSNVSATYFAAIILHWLNEMDIGSLNQTLKEDTHAALGTGYSRDLDHCRLFWLWPCGRDRVNGPKNRLRGLSHSLRAVASIRISARRPGSLSDSK